MRRHRKKGGNKDKVFGCDLLEHLNATSQEIPLVLRCCSEFVETNGITDGIYRLSGVSSNIQKLRGEFESDAAPDLNKDLYLQDIHCVSSLCKAYFRELPNPLLTYQLYDKFAEAVALQLEEERLVKIRDVLKELPSPHYRTLEFLMRHLVRMASHSAETNMHSRNLAIVWAPNLLRSKDIEACGFNGTAAFMEVRVQSIVVEFILTHVPQLFPQLGVPAERRKSLPSPTAACVHDEGFFKNPPSLQIHHFGNISPGDGPLAMRPYHAIIEGTDKRKGSLKGRKWMSIFNIGVPRRRNKHSVKEKDRQTLRPARSMDSLSTYPNEGSRHAGPRLSTTTLSPSPLAVPSDKPSPLTLSTASSDVPLSTKGGGGGGDVPGSNRGGGGGGGGGACEYAVTYRRGTGQIGTQGTYTALDPDGSGQTAGGDSSVQSRSPGQSSKVGRRAAMHITGPTMVTVPLHITSSLALGVLQRGGADRVIHRGKRDERDGETEKKPEENQNSNSKAADGNKVASASTKEGVVETEGGRVENRVEEKEKEQKEEMKKEEEKRKPEMLKLGSRSVSREQRDKSLTSNIERENKETHEKDAESNSDYMDMTAINPADFRPAESQNDEDSEKESSGVLNSTEIEAEAEEEEEEGDVEEEGEGGEEEGDDDRGMSGYVQDNFDFLDQMDCSGMDHMDCSVPYQVNEFSVEPPGHSDDEYEAMAQVHTAVEHTHPHTHPHTPPHTHPHTHPGDPDTHTHMQSELLKPHRPLSLDLGTSRQSKSLSLPYMTSPIISPDDYSSEEEEEEEEEGALEDQSDSGSEDGMYNINSSEEEQDEFTKSLPADFFLDGFDRDVIESDCKNVRERQSQNSKEKEKEERQLGNVECNKESTAGESGDVEHREDTNKRREEKELKMEEEDVHLGRDHLGNDWQSKATGDIHAEQLADCEARNDEPKQDAVAAEDVVDHLPEITEEEHSAADTHLEESTSFIQPRSDFTEDLKGQEIDEGEDTQTRKEVEDTCREVVLEIEETVEETIEKRNKDKSKNKKMRKCAIRKPSSVEIWDELEDVICEVIEDQESMQGEKEKDAVKEKQIEKVSVEVECQDGGDASEADIGMKAEEKEVGESIETTDDKLETQAAYQEKLNEEFEENDSNLPEHMGLDEAIQRKCDIDNDAMLSDGMQCHDTEEAAISADKDNYDNERPDEQSGINRDGVEAVSQDTEHAKKSAKQHKMPAVSDEGSDESIKEEGEKCDMIRSPGGEIGHTKPHSQDDRSDKTITVQDGVTSDIISRPEANLVDKNEFQESANCNQKGFKEENKCGDKTVSNEGTRCAGSPGGVGRKLVASKPRVYQARAVPVVPPKPQHCKITALTLRQKQQQQQQQQQQGDRGMTDQKKNTQKKVTTATTTVRAEQDRMLPERDRMLPEQDRMLPEKIRLNRMLPEQDKMLPERDGMLPVQDRKDRMLPAQDRMLPEQDKMLPEQDKMLPERDRMLPEQDRMLPGRDTMLPEQERMDRMLPDQDRMLPERDRTCLTVAGETDRDSNRNSPISMCFDEAVAIATMRREREKECEK